MAWDDFNASYNYLKVKSGETRELVPVGEPDCKEDDKENKSILFNMVDLANGGTVGLLRCGVVLAGKIKSALKNGALTGSVAVVIKREGSGMDDTTYEVGSRKLTAEEIKVCKAAECCLRTN